MPNFDTLPDDARIRASHVVQIVPFSLATMWRKVKDGTFPAPTKLSAGITAWRLGDVRAWLKGV